MKMGPENERKARRRLAEQYEEQAMRSPPSVGLVCALIAVSYRLDLIERTMGDRR